MSKTMKAVLAVWIAVLVAAAGWITWDFMQGRGPTIGGNFSLVDHNGRAVTQDTFKGKPTLIYFGFTFCPDVCPTSLLLMETALQQLGPDAAQKVNPLLITIDPERDTAKLLKDYVTNFGPTFLGLTGTQEQVAAAAKAFRVYYQKVPGKSGGPYLMDHSSIIYVLDRNGRFVTHFTHEAKAEQIAAAVAKLL
ncbi:MAG TPA: SCO family protein [Reyranellaceae bacterium]|nr:SCO family protein [Reyranellaceae bacterium]